MDICYDRSYDYNLDPVIFDNVQRRSGMAAGIYLDRSSLRILSSSSLEILSMEGFLIGRITSTGQVMTLESSEDYGAVRTVFEDEVIAAIAYGPAADLLTAAGGLRFGFDDRKKIDALKAFSAHLQSSSSLPCALENLPREADDQMRLSSHFFNSFYITTCHRRICHLDTGDVGVGPKIMHEGDIVVILIGAEMPHVLRPVNGGQYEFIGAIYIPGLMRGEVFDMGLETRTFDLI